MSRLKEKHFHDWVRGFIFRHNLISSDQNAVVALSGGRDSMLLAYLAIKMNEEKLIKKLSLVHIDHGLRAKSSVEAMQVKKNCLLLGHDCCIVKVQEKAPKKNIEQWARSKRYHLLKGFLGVNDVLLLGHHIDDSFEWFLKQMLSSSRHKTLGIPLINGPIRRPLHCLSRDHINYWVNKLKINYIDDPTNSDTRFERNFLRQKVSKALKSYYPMSMKHFSSFLNQQLETGCSDLVINKYSKNITLVEQKNSDGYFFGCEKELREEVILLSDKNRGELQLTLKKLINAQAKGKRGPLHISGNVRAYCYPALIILCHIKGIKEFEVMDNQFSLLLSRASQIPDNDFLKVEKEKKLGINSLKSDLLFSKTIKEATRQKLWVRMNAHISLIKRRKKQKNCQI